MNVAVGFFGKLLSHGDFVSRRLPADWLEHWDAWLQRGLCSGQQQLGADWPAHYLVAPIWRFLLGSTSVDQLAWAGILMPSVDRVGRYYPLTLAAPLDLGADLGASYPVNLDWFAQLESLALSSLTAEFQFDHFDRVLRELPAPNASPLAGEPSAPEAQQRLLLPDLARFAMPARDPHCLWLSLNSGNAETTICYSRGLPSPKALSALFVANAEGWS